MSSIAAILDEELAAARSAILRRLGALLGTVVATEPPKPARGAQRAPRRDPVKVSNGGSKARRMSSGDVVALKTKTQALFRGDVRLKAGDVLRKLRTKDRKRVSRALGALVADGVLFREDAGTNARYLLASKK